jgi:hypothetical protein
LPHSSQTPPPGDAPALRAFLKAFVSETLLYGLFVAAYFFCVLHFLGNWLNTLFQQHRGRYAVLAVLLIAGQGFALDFLADWLLRRFRPERKQ